MPELRDKKDSTNKLILLVPEKQWKKNELTSSAKHKKQVTFLSAHANLKACNGDKLELIV